jgi:C-terminal processing protease CtpA/Prc
MFYRTCYILLATATIVAPLAAQRSEPPRADVQLYSVRPDGPAMAWTSVTSSGRAMIGVTVGLRPSASDSLGATISAVTPGGPAAKAGLLAGDIITKFNGTALVVRGQAIEDDGQSGPGLRLIELVARVEPGDTVAVEWRRERQRKTAQIVTQARNVWVAGDNDGVRVFTAPTPGAYAFSLDMEGRERQLAELRSHLGEMRSPMMTEGRFMIRMNGPLGGVQFAPINPDLGRYFGVTEGILILDTPDTSAHLDLKGGDVIVAIDGRKATDVDQLMRIISSYNDGETINFDVMRDKRRVSVPVKAEEVRGGGRMRVLEGELAPMRRPAVIETTPVPDMPPPATAPRARSRSGT